MDYKEEQQQEIEILQSIYPDELEVISETQFTITLLLDTQSERKHRIILKVKYPETYPEVAPDLEVKRGEVEEVEDEYADSDEDEEDGDDDDDQPKLVLISEQVNFENEDLTQLRNILIEEAEEQIGIPSIFALASTLKDKAEEIFEKRVNQKQKEYDDELLAKEREEQKKFIGTKVTKESFEEWRLKFRKELGMDERLKKRNELLHHGKLSGKEIFEKGLAGDDETMEELNNDVSKLTTE